MAKNPNESDNGSTPNQAGDFGLSRLSEIGAAAGRIPAEERELRRRAREARQGVNAYEGMTAEQRNFDVIKKFHSRDVNTLSRTEPRIRLGVEARQERFASQAVNAVGQAFSESGLSGRMNEMSGTTEAQLAGTSLMGMPYNDLATRRRNLMGQLGQLGEQNVSMAANAIGRRGLNADIYGAMSGNAAQAQGIMRELAPINAAMGQQAALGMDPKSRIGSVFASGQRAQDILSGGGGGKTAEAAEKLVKALEDLQTASEETKEHFLGLAEAAEKELKGSGGGGRGGRDIAGWANVAGAGFQAAAQATQQIGVNQRLAQQQNMSGLAAIENQKYQTYKSAAGGDVASLMLLSQFGGAEAFGRSLGTAANISVAAQAAGGAAQIVAGGAKIASTLNPAENALSTSAAQANRQGGIMDVMAGTAAAGVAGFDLARGVSAGQARLAGTNANLEARRQNIAITAEQIQGFRDFGVGLGAVSQGMGANGENFLKRTIDDNNLDRMKAYRIGPDQFTKLAQMGVSTMGSTFSEEQVFGARAMERRGLGTAQDSMGRMAALAGAGVNNPQASMAGVLEVALTKGLDSSKALNAVAEHTASMAGASTGRVYGMDTTAAAASLLTAGIGKDTPNKEAALTRAGTIQETLGRIGQNVDVSFAGMVNTARISKTTGLGGVSAILAGKIDDATLMSLNAGSGEKLQQMGIDVRGKNVGTLVSQLKEDRQLQLLEAGNFGVNYDRGSVLKKLNKGEKLSADEELGVARAAGLQGLSGQELKSRVMSIDAAINPNAPTGTKAMTMPGAEEKGMRKDMDDLRTLGFVQLTAAAKQAATGLGGAAVAIQKITDAFKGLEGQIPAVEKAAGGAAAKSSGSMGKEVLEFHDSVKDFSAAVNALMVKAGISSGSGKTANRAKNPPPHQ